MIQALLVSSQPLMNGSIDSSRSIKTFYKGPSYTDLPLDILLKIMDALGARELSCFLPTSRELSKLLYVSDQWKVLCKSQSVQTDPFQDSIQKKNLPLQIEELVYQRLIASRVKKKEPWVMECFWGDPLFLVGNRAVHVTVLSNGALIRAHEGVDGTLWNGKQISRGLLADFQSLPEGGAIARRKKKMYIIDPNQNVRTTHHHVKITCMAVLSGPVHGTRIATVAGRAVDIWSTNGHFMASLVTHSQHITSIVSLGEGFMTGSIDGSVILWSEDSVPIKTFIPHSEDLDSLIDPSSENEEEQGAEVSSTRRYIDSLAVLSNGNVVAGLRPLQEKGYKTRIIPLSTGKFLVVNDRRILLKSRLGGLIKTIEGEHHFKEVVGFPNGRFASIAYGESGACIWSEEGDLMGVIQDNYYPISIAVNANNHLLIGLSSGLVKLCAPDINSLSTPIRPWWTTVLNTLKLISSKVFTQKRLN